MSIPFELRMDLFYRLVQEEYTACQHDEITYSEAIAKGGEYFLVAVGYQPSQTQQEEAADENTCDHPDPAGAQLLAGLQAADKNRYKNDIVNAQYDLEYGEGQKANE